MDDQYLIWSEEHGAWWAPKCRGYTMSMAKAGRYPEEMARAIAASANAHGSFCEVPVRESLAMAEACKQPSGGR